MKELLSELKNACRGEPSRSDSDAIARGRSTWFRGRPAPATDGTIALALSDDARVIINERDVRSVKKEAEEYSVEVSAEAHFLLRLEKTLKATPDCGCKDGGHRPPIRQTRDAGTEAGPTIDIVEVEVCDLICGDIVLAGIKIPVCVRVNGRTEKS